MDEAADKAIAKAQKKGEEYNPKEDTGKNMAKVRRLLTKYSVDTAQEQFKNWVKMEETLLVKFIDGNVKAQFKDGTFRHSEFSTHIPDGLTQPGYTDVWKEQVVESHGSIIEVK